MKKSKILIMGDVMLDTYHFGKVERISPEAPVPVFLESGKTKHTPGGAANVAVNVAAIDIEVDLFSIVGNDAAGSRLMELLRQNKVGMDYIVTISDKTTTQKTRYIGPNNQQMMRVDEECTASVGTDAILEKADELERKMDEYSLVLLSDYNKGFLVEKLVQKIICAAKKYEIPVLVDVKDKKFIKYKNATLLKPNRQELGDLTGFPVNTEKEIADAAIFLCKEACCKYVLATLGKDGMILVDQERVIQRIKSVTREVYDVTGAGDTTIAYLAAGLSKGKRITEAMDIANIAAGVQVSKVGTSIVYPEEVKQLMNDEFQNLSEKILDDRNKDDLKKILKKKEHGCRIVFTNGCFDIIHSGHITYLNKARKLGDILVVGVNSDESVKRLKGANRPVNSLEDRELVLAALSCVDYIVPFKEDTPLDLIKCITPDVLVKGGDYCIEEIVGSEYVQRTGGEVRVLPFVSGKSTTGIIEKARGLHDR